MPIREISVSPDLRSSAFICGYPKQTMNQLIEFISGKKTYLVAAAAIAYLAVCQFTGKAPSEEIMGMFGFLGLTFLRMGVSKTNQALEHVHQHIEAIQDSLPEQPKAE